MNQSFYTTDEIQVGDFLQTPLCSCEIPGKYATLLDRIYKNFGQMTTVGDLLAISQEEFRAIRGIGVKYAKTLKQLKVFIVSKGQLELGLECQTEERDLQVWEIPVDSVSKKYSPLHKTLLRKYHIQTYADILRVNPTQFLETPGVGIKKYNLLLKWRGELIARSPRDIDLSTFREYRFNYCALDRGERSLIKKFLKREMSTKAVSPTFVMEQSCDEILNIKGFGRKNSDALKSLQQKICAFIEGHTQSNRILMSVHFGQELGLQEIGLSILADLQEFSQTLSGQNKIIFTRRTGFGDELFTLGDIGAQFGLTRERVRQNEKALLFELTHSVRISPETLANGIENLPASTVLLKMPELRGAFTTDNACLGMLARLANLDVHEFISKAAPSIPQKALEDFFCSAKYPLRKDDLLFFLQEDMNMDDCVAEQAMLVLQREERITINGGFVLPKNVKKEVAVVYHLAGHPSGLDWVNISNNVNKMRICNAPLPLHHPDGVFHRSAYIFQSAAREFSHIHYLGLSKQEIKYWLSDIQKVLNKYDYDALHLRSEYYESLPEPKPDYYRIRFVARNYGAQAGIYFSGRSQADTVSLDPEASQISQTEALARHLEKRAMTFDSVVRHVKSKTEGHARFHLSALISEGRVVRLDDGTFAAPAIAFANIETDKVLGLVRSMLSEDERVHHMGVLATQINRLSGLDMTPRSCRSLIAAYAKQNKWHLRGYLVALRPFEWSGLIDVLRDAPNVKGEDLVAWVQQRVCAPRVVIIRAIYNSGARFAEAEQNSYSGGLAADVMQELFDL